ncbi:unnamed protein product, partial [Anisakis simplex]
MTESLQFSLRDHFLVAITAIVIGDVCDCGVDAECFIIEVGIISHEILHSLGIWHEQSRSDRDEYINVNYDNLFPGMEGNFEKRTEVVTSNLEQPYDLGSVMHYSSTAFARDQSTATITTRDGNYQHTIGQRKTLSFKDAKIINLQYCMGVCTRQLPCQNSGYTDPRECSECRCPEGYGGTFCEKVAESTIPDCGGELNATSTYQTLQME